MERYSHLYPKELEIVAIKELDYLKDCGFSDLDSLSSFMSAYDAYWALADANTDGLHASLSREELPFDEDSFQRIVAHYDELLAQTYGTPNPN